jgi:hypothetical protein
MEKIIRLYHEDEDMMDECALCGKEFSNDSVIYISDGAHFCEECASEHISHFEDEESEGMPTEEFIGDVFKQEERKQKNGIRSWSPNYEYPWNNEDDDSEDWDDED